MAHFSRFLRILKYIRLRGRRFCYAQKARKAVRNREIVHHCWGYDFAGNDSAGAILVVYVGGIIYLVRSLV